jgi:hypothetical protein
VKYVKKDHYTLLQKQESLPSMDENWTKNIQALYLHTVPHGIRPCNCSVLKYILVYGKV